MARYSLCLALLATLAGGALAGHVLTLTGDTISEAIKSNEKLIVEFYAPWCGHCKRLEPEYESAAEALKEDGIILAKVDATEEQNKALAAKYGVRGYPTLKVFRGHEDKPGDYEGPREADGIVSYARKLFGPSTELLADASAVEAAQAADLMVLGVFPAGEASAEFAAFKAVADAMREEVSFRHVTDATLVPAAAGAAAVIVYKDFDEPVTKYDGALEEAELRAFIEKASTPRLISLDRSPRNKKALAKVFGDSAPKVLGAVPAGHSDLAAFREQLIAIKDAHDDLHVLYVDPAENSAAMSFFDLADADLPALLVHEPASNSKYVAKRVAADAAAAWVADYRAGKVPKHIKSAAPPADNDGPVTVVVASTLEEIAFSGKDVLIEFYAPWCGHCKQLAPIYEQLGEAFKDDATVVIAKMDATENDVVSDKFTVRGFPTIYFVSGGDGAVHEYSGERTLEALKAFVEKTGSASAAADGDAAADADREEL